MTPSEALAAIAQRIHPCPVPDVLSGMDLCPCGCGEDWPCPITQAAWIARGADPPTEARRILHAELALSAEDLG